MLSNEFGQAFAPFPGTAERGIGVAEKLKGFAHEQVGRGLTRFAGSLTIERPIKVALDSGPAWFHEAFGNPVSHEGGLADATPSYQRVEVQLWIGPGGIERCEPRFAAEQN